MLSPGNRVHPLQAPCPSTEEPDQGSFSCGGRSSSWLHKLVARASGLPGFQFANIGRLQQPAAAGELGWTTAHRTVSELTGHITYWLREAGCCRGLGVVRSQEPGGALTPHPHLASITHSINNCRIPHALLY